METATQTELELQVKVSKILSRGFIFSIVWLGGVGSLMAVILGIRALRIIKNSETKLSGKVLAWWCIVLGGLGMIIMSSAMIVWLLRWYGLSEFN